MSEEQKLKQAMAALSVADEKPAPVGAELATKQQLAPQPTITVHDIFKQPTHEDYENKYHRMLPDKVIDLARQMREQKKFVSTAQIYSQIMEEEQQKKAAYDSMTDDQRRVQKIKDRMMAARKKKLQQQQHQTTTTISAN